MITIAQTSSKRQLKDFIDFPHELFKDDPNYVPELFIAQRDILTKHPFMEHSAIQPFLAYKEGKIVGRVAAILNNNHNAFNNTKEGFFGFFDSIDDKDVVAALMNAVDHWLREKGVLKILGPVNPSTNESCGLLVDGYDTPPAAMMTYNKPYYVSLLEDAGFTKKADLLAYKITVSSYQQRPLRQLDAIDQRLLQKDITIRKANLKKFEEEVTGIQQVYNEAWDKNLGFVPMTAAEFKYMAKDLKLVLDADFCLVAEHGGKIIAFALAIPDINKVLIKIKKGRLFPTGIFKLLTQRKKIKALRVITLGVTEPYRKLGIEAVMYARLIEASMKKNILTAEASWILEDNVMMNRGIKTVNGELYKRYRLYEKQLQALPE